MAASINGSSPKRTHLLTKTWGHRDAWLSAGLVAQDWLWAPDQLPPFLGSHCSCVLSSSSLTATFCWNNYITPLSAQTV